MKPKTLGPVSATFINTLYQRGKMVFTLDDAVQITGKDRIQAIKFIATLVKREILAQLKPGVYWVLQMGQESSQLGNWPLIAKALADNQNYFIAYYSAMRLHGMTTHPIMTIYITTLKRHRPKKINALTYEFIYSRPQHFWGEAIHWVSKHDNVLVSNIERTILDALDRPDLCGGIKEIVIGIWLKQKNINWQQLLSYAKKYRTKATSKRLGFILELLNLGTDILPDLLKFITPAKDYVLLDPIGETTGKHLSRWRVQININPEELEASVWG